MTLEADLYALVSPIVDLWPDAAEAGTATPYATFQQVGGQVINPIDGSDPGLHHARIQINVWSTDRVEAHALMFAIEAALRPNPFAGRPVGAFFARYEETLKLRGAQQDFDVWHS